jgi:hypothetical protein
VLYVCLLPGQTEVKGPETEAGVVVFLEIETAREAEEPKQLFALIPNVPEVKPDENCTTMEFVP